MPLGQISNHTVAKDLVTIQQALLRATPSRAGHLVGLLGPILPVRTRMAGDLTAHHRGATPNQVSDTRLGQAHIHPRHDRRAILDSKHPTTPHDQPPNSITATRKLLTPYDTAVSDIAQILGFIQEGIDGADSAFREIDDTNKADIEASARYLESSQKEPT